MRRIPLTAAIVGGLFALYTTEASAVVCARGVYRAGRAGPPLSHREAPLSFTEAPSRREALSFVGESTEVLVYLRRPRLKRARGFFVDCAEFTGVEIPGELPTASSIGWFRNYVWPVGSVRRASLRRRKSRLARSRFTRRKRSAAGWSASCSPAAQRRSVRASMPSNCAPSPAPSAEAACLAFGRSRTRTRNERVG
jgi:hypothetical protein